MCVTSLLPVGTNAKSVLNDASSPGQTVVENTLLTTQIPERERFQQPRPQRKGIVSNDGVGDSNLGAASLYRFIGREASIAAVDGLAQTSVAENSAITSSVKK